jgi:DNA-binding MarR family transcriptional regulator
MTKDDPTGTSAVDVVVAATRVLMGITVRSVPETADVTLHQFRALALLDAHGSLNVNALAERVGVSPSTATRLCDRLVDKRLVRRRTARESRREVTLSLTPAGAALVADAIARRRDAIGGILSHMPAARRRQLVEALQAFVAASGDGADGDGWPSGIAG